MIVICLFNGICGQLPYSVLRFTLRFLTFTLVGRPEPTLRSPAPAPHHRRPQNCKNFLLNCGLRFHPQGRQIITRLHGVISQNTVTFQHHDCAAWTINLAVLHEVICNVYQVCDTAPTHTVCTVRNKLLVIWLNTTQHINWCHI